jgi:hypothetical protein
MSVNSFKSTMKCKPQQSPGNRAIDVTDSKGQVSESTADLEADERKELVKLETEKLDGRKPSNHATGSKKAVIYVISNAI